MAVLAGLLSILASGASAEVDRGQALYENHCKFCHEDRVHTRKNRLVGSPESLRAWVTSWSVHAGLNWDAQDIEDVARYLDQRFYQFAE